MNHAAYSDAYIRAILDSVKTIAMVGLSANVARPSYFALGYLQKKGFRIYGVNPALAGQSVHGAPCVARLADIPEAIDMVDIFRSADAVSDILAQTLALNQCPKVFWMQLGVRHEEAAAQAETAGMKVVMNRCPKIEIGRLTGEIGWLGINSGLIRSRPVARMRGRQE